MTVAELIEQLKNFNPDRQVWINSQVGEYDPEPISGVQLQGWHPGAYSGRPGREKIKHVVIFSTL